MKAEAEKKEKGAEKERKRKRKQKRRIQGRNGEPRGTHEGPKAPLEPSPPPSHGFCPVLGGAGDTAGATRGGSQGPLTFGGLGHGGGEAVHVVATVTVITEEQLVLGGEHGARG